MADGYSIKHIDEFEQMEGSGGCTWRLARKSLGEPAFGFNVVDIEPGGALPEHNHADSGEEEVFCVLEGQGTLVTDGDEHPAPPGTFIRYAPKTERTVKNESDANLRLLLIGVPGDSGYEPMSWA